MHVQRLKVDRAVERTGDLDVERFGATVQKQQNETIYTFEQPAHSAFYLIKGNVRLVNQKTGASKMIREGDFFGDRSIFSSKNIYAEAVTNVEYIQISDGDFESLMEQDGKLALHIIEHLSKHHICKEKDQTRTQRYFTQLVKTMKNGFRQVKPNEEECTCL